MLPIEVHGALKYGERIVIKVIGILIFYMVHVIIYNIELLEINVLAMQNVTKVRQCVCLQLTMVTKGFPISH